MLGQLFGMFATLLLAATVPVLKVCLLCGTGWICARQGLLSPASRKTISGLVYYLFMPCLVFSKLGPALSWDRLCRWWPLPINTCASLAVGMLLGYVQIPIVKPEEWLKPHVVVCTALGNVGTLPLVLVVTLVNHQSVPMFQGFTNVVDTALAYVVMGMWVAQMVNTTVGYSMLQPKSTVVHAADVSETDSKDPLLRSHSLVPRPTSPRTSKNMVAGPGMPGQLKLEKHWQIRWFNQGKATSTVQYHALHPEEAGEGHGADIGSRTGAVRAGDPKEMAFKRTGRSGKELEQVPEIMVVEPGVELCKLEKPLTSSSVSSILAAMTQPAAAPPRGLLRRYCWSWMSQLVNPVVLAVVASLFFGLVPPFKSWMWSSQAPLAILTDATNMFHQCAIPCMLLVLGATLEKGPGQARVPARMTVSLCVARLVVLPLVGSVLILGAWHLRLFTPPDLVFVLVMMLSWTAPAAMNVHTFATLHSNGEPEVAALLFWQYMACIFSMPCWLMIYLWLLNKYMPNP